MTLSHLHITSQCLQLVWLSVTSSPPFVVANPGEWFIYQIGCHPWGKVVRCSEVFCCNNQTDSSPPLHPPPYPLPPPLTDNPSELGNSPEPCRGDGVQREPEWEAHIVHDGTPAAPARRHNSQGHGELGQRTSELPTVRASRGKGESFQKCLSVYANSMWNLL